MNRRLTSSRLRGCLLALAIAAATPGLADAQGTAFALFDGVCFPRTPCPPSRIVEVDLDRGAVHAIVPLACPGSALQVTADGRYLTWLEQCDPNAPTLSRWLMDRTTGQRVTLGAGPVAMVAHPSEVRFLFTEGSTLVSLTAAGRSSVPMPSTGCANGPFTLSPGGERLLQFCSYPPEFFTIRTTATGAAVQHFTDTLLVHLGGVALDERGENLYWANDIRRDNSVSLVRYDIATGLMAASYYAVTGPVDGQGPLVERRTGRVFFRAGNALTALHPVTLQLLGTVAVNGAVPLATVFHPARALAYVLSQTARGSATQVLDIVDTTPLRVLSSIPLQSPPDALKSFIVAPHPPAPVNLAATVAGHRVTVTWAAAPQSPAITGYDLEVAGTPGGPALLTLRVAGTSFVAENVPAGAFSLRVRARNHAGVSAPSSEVGLRVLP